MYIYVFWFWKIKLLNVFVTFGSAMFIKGPDLEGVTKIISVHNLSCDLSNQELSII